MHRKNFDIKIDAPKEKVWETLWGTETYPQWTAAFAEGSKAESDWEEGSKILFLESKNRGMVSRISKKKNHEVMEFEHLGFIDEKGNEDYESEKVKEWAGSKERYELEEENGSTIVKVTMDIADEYKDYFNNTWPKALQELKKLSES